MKAGLLSVLFVVLFSFSSSAQDKCASASYLQSSLKNDATLADKINTTENFIRNYKKDGNILSRIESTLIKIPVVVHILYHTPEEKISDAQVVSQVEALNKYFRRRNSDTVNTPAYFRALAADCEIEFQLATTAPGKKFSNGITRNYTPITKWGADDKMKFTAEMGADAWDAKNYLNIWVCNLDKFAGYASIPGTDAGKDGIVISYKAFGTTGTVQPGYALGKTAVHEVGHWLGLKHIWGDANCGDDGVSDTPKQASYTSGCPNTVRVTCGNGPYGDMYMNYMDLTNDQCINMFTLGQKERMMALFTTGGFRNSILSTNAFLLPQVQAIPVPDDDPKWLEPRLYPNPANNELNLDIAYDIRWVGKKIFVTNILGQTVMNVEITAKNTRIDITKLKAGIYFFAAKKEDGVSLKIKFIKL